MADYNAQNPFEEDEDKRGSVKKPTPSLPPKSTLREPDAFSGRYTATTNSPIDPTWEGVKRKEAELKRREDDLAKRETNLQEREQSVPKGRVNNFPPCKPLVHQNIAEDMPTDATKSMVRRAFIGWFATLVAFLWNLIMLLSALIARGGTSYITGFILSIVYIIFAYPISFFIFRLLYQAARKGKPSLYVMYFIFIWFEMATWAFYAVGIYQYGGGGFFAMLDSFKSSKVVGVFGVICFVVWVLLIIFHFFIFVLARIQYGKVGGLQQAKKEAKSAAAQQMAEHPEMFAEGIKVTAQV